MLQKITSQIPIASSMDEPQPPAPVPKKKKMKRTIRGFGTCVTDML